jgi:hypothetical protein
MNAKKWFPLAEIDVACADVSVAWTAGKQSKCVVLMHFSRVLGGPDVDLEITFSNPLSLQWEDESFGLVPAPTVLPKCANDRFSQWTHPTLIVEDSRWADAYASRKYAANDPALLGVTHYFLVSMNDLVHVLCESKPVARWVSSADSNTTSS